jgi:hypothetical protein
MNFRETTQEDLEYMTNHSVSRGFKCPDRTDYCFTLEHDVVYGIGGFRLITPTTAWCWVNMAEIAKEHIVVSYRVIKEWIEIFAEEHKLKRLQAYIECDFPEAVRMAQHLGFKKESIMHSFIDDKPAFMYVRIM